MGSVDSGARVADLSDAERAAMFDSVGNRKTASEDFEQVDKGSIKESPELRGFRAFVSTAAHANTKILVNPKGAKVVNAAPVAGAPLGLIPSIRRDGDIFANFTEGVLVTKDPQVIAWCEANPSICRDASDPRTRMWVSMKNMQTQTPSRDVTLDPTIDVDAELFPEGFDLTPREADASGDDAVAAALSSRDSAAAVDAKEAEAITGLS